MSYRVPTLNNFPWQHSVKDKDTLTPPGSPSAGDRYLIAGTGAGAWTGHNQAIARYESGWLFDAPTEGWIVWVEDENLFYYYNGSTWAVLSSGVYEPVLAAASPGPTLKYYRGDKSWATLNQAAIPELTTASSPAFVTVKCSALTDGYIPYHVSDAAGMANSIVYTDGTRIGIGCVPSGPFEVAGTHVWGDRTLTMAINGTAGAGAGGYPGLAFLSNGTAQGAIRSGGGPGLQFYVFAADGALSFEAMRITMGGSVLIGATAAVGSEKLRVNGQIYCDDNVSALTFTDRTPYYDGDALKDISSIKGKDGKIDHSTLPVFVQALKKQAVMEDQLVTRTRQKTKKVTSQVPVESIELINGKYTKITTLTTKEEDEVLFEEFDLYDEKGKALKDKDKKSIKHRVPVMEEYQTTESVKVGETDVIERNLGGMISMLTVAVQQLTNRIEKLEKK